MIGTLTEPMIASRALARSARRGSLKRPHLRRFERRISNRACGAAFVAHAEERAIALVVVVLQ